MTAARVRGRAKGGVAPLWARGPFTPQDIFRQKMKGFRPASRAVRRLGVR